MYQITKNFFFLAVLYCYLFDTLSSAMQLTLFLGMLALILKPQKFSRAVRLRINGGKHTTAEWKLMCFYYGNRCAACDMRSGKLTKDHIVPVSKGGTDSIKNIQPLCDKCNKSKGTKVVRY